MADPATTYLRIAFLGTTPLLIMLATTGVLRGLQDTRTPLVVAVAGNLLNIVLNLLLCTASDRSRAGIAGLGAGARSSPRWPARPRCSCRGPGRPARGSLADARPARDPRRRPRRGALVVRTLTLRAALLLTTYAVTIGAVDGRQAVDLAAHQLALTIWTFLAFALDAIAIAAQAITGRSSAPGTSRAPGKSPGGWSGGAWSAGW